jgi:hypothetical protein
LLSITEGILDPFIEVDHAENPKVHEGLVGRNQDYVSAILLQKSFYFMEAV